MVLNERQQKRITYTVVGAVSLLFVLVIVLISLIATRHAVESTEQALLNQIADMEQKLIDLNRDTAYINDPRFLEDYILFELGFGQPGQTIYFK